jgi:hypothetical protein
MTAPLEREILDRGQDDIIQLAEIVSIARMLGFDDGPELLAVVRRGLTSLINDGLAVIGSLDESGSVLTVQAWQGDADAVTARVVRGLSRSGKHSGDDPPWGDLLARAHPKGTSRRSSQLRP